MSRSTTAEHANGRTAALSLAALGVVFGDIGTSPLYAFRESLIEDRGLVVDELNVLGVLSLMFWSLIIVITIKYLLIVMRADNEGEGGILALVALIADRGGGRRWLILLGLFGTALLYGDGMITPAISVLSAVEGIAVAAPSVEAWIVPIVVVILIGLFLIQPRGTDTVGRFFGPVMVAWFSVLALLGGIGMSRELSVLRAFNPVYGARFFIENGLKGYLVLGSVFLVVTGGEALYADLGHFGRRPIELSWFSIVLPALMLNYLGQGALLLRDPTAIENPFFNLAPKWAQLPLTALATLATVIASQALITGAFSLTVQAINMDYLPRMEVIRTSDIHRGQVYVPVVNWGLLVACVAIVISFRSSAALAAAYGVAVTMTMAITTMLVAVVALNRWGWSPARAALVLIPLFVVDLAFLGANIFKIPSGGWLPLVVGAFGFGVFTTWRSGRQLIEKRINRQSLTIGDFVKSIEQHPPLRHPGTGVYLRRSTGAVPAALLTNLRYNESLHENVVFVAVITDDRPHVNRAERAHLISHDHGFYDLEMRYGFKDRVDLDRDLKNLMYDDVAFRDEDTTYFLGRVRIESTDRPGMARWRERIFIYLHRNAGDAAHHFHLPPDRCVDIGLHIDI